MIHVAEALALYDGQSRKDRHVATVMNMILRFIATKPRPSKHVVVAPKDRDHSSNSGAHA
jgi:hypothetical protein